MRLCGELLAAASAATAAAVVVILRREKLVDRKAHLAEQLTGIVARRAAFLARHTEIVDRHQHLYVTDELDDGKHPDGNQYDLAVMYLAEIAAVAIDDALRDTAASAAAATAAILVPLTGIHGSGAQNDRFRHLHGAARHVARRHLLTVVLIRPELAVKHLHAALAAEKDDLFLENADAADRGAGRIPSGEDIELHLKEEGEVAGIIAAVKRQRFDIYKGFDNFRFSGANTDRVIDQHLIVLGEIHLQILQTVLVCAGIVYTSGVDTDRVFAAMIVTALFGHEKSPYNMD